MSDFLPAWLPEVLKLGVILLSFPLVTTVAVLLLWLTMRQPGIKVLRANAFYALGLAIIVTVFVVVFASNDLAIPVLSLYDTRVLTRGTLVVVPIAAALYWLRFVWRSP